MRWPVLVGLGPLVALSSAGCVGTETTGSIPQPLTVFAAGSQDNEEVVLAYYPQIGYVRATRQVLAGLGSTLEPASGPNRTVEACRKAAWEEAVQIGGAAIEAVSAGRERVGTKGRVVGPVRMRITYRKVTGSYSIYEVREATVSCTLDREGKIVQAT